MIALGTAVCTLAPLWCQIARTVRRRGLAVGFPLAGLLGLIIVLSAGSEPNGPGPIALVAGIAGSVCLGWLGYRIYPRGPLRSPPQTLLARLREPKPSARVLQPADVVGVWGFYADACGQSVALDLQAAGRYTQAIVGNDGRRLEGPGGTWTITGPRLELSAYRSAARGTSEPVQWVFGDWERELVLFARDDPHGRALVALRRPASRIW